MSYRDPSDGIFKVNRRDTSRLFSSYTNPADRYNGEACSCCFLGFAHTVACHDEKVREHSEAIRKHAQATA